MSQQQCVFLAGCSGKLGLEICQKLVEHGFKVKGLINHESSREVCMRCGCSDCVVGDMCKLTQEDYEKLIEGCDIVIDAAGSSYTQSNNEKELNLVEYEATVRLCDACCEKGVKRFICLSALGCDHPEDELACATVKKNPKFGKDVFEADKHIQNCRGLHYTIFRPGDLTDEVGSGKVYLSTKIPRNKVWKSTTISRFDLAELIVRSINCENCFRNTLEVINGFDKDAMLLDEALTTFHQATIMKQQQQVESEQQQKQQVTAV
ncbi:hypothetical protein ABK040_014391 [Willaertia magna]